MKTNHLYKIAVIVLISMCILSANAQQKYIGKLTVVNAKAQQQGNIVVLDINMVLSNIDIANQQSLTITPVLKNDTKSYPFPPIIINGKTRQKAYLRGQALNSKHISTPAYGIMKSEKKLEQKLNYKASMPYESWMDQAKLVIAEDLCGCGGKQAMVAENDLLKNIILERKPSPEVDKEVVKVVSEYKNGTLNFPQNRTIILENYMGNKTQMEQIEQFLNEMKADRNIQITSIDIAGYASPEGNLQTNQELSAGRIEALKHHLLSKINLPENIYHIKYSGENWDGLINLVETSSLKNKDEVLSIIKNTSDIALRKNKLKALDKGNTYTQLLREFYPKLRKVIFQINYTIPGNSSAQ